MGKRQRRRTRQQPLSRVAALQSDPTLLGGPAWARPLLSGQVSRLEELAALVDEQRRLAQRQRQLVTELVAVGTGWPQIAAALGVSRQAARQQFVRTHLGPVAEG
jgi:hypothetical protein